MKKILVFLEHTEGTLPKTTLAAITAANLLKDRWTKNGLIGVCLGKRASAAASDALSYGISEAYYSEDVVFDRYLTIPYATAVCKTFHEQDCDTVVAAASAVSKDLMPRVAVMLDAGQASEVVAINNDGTLKRTIYAGRMFCDVEICTANRVVTIRSSVFPPARKTPGAGRKVNLAVEVLAIGDVLSYELSAGERPKLSDADVVVSGGKALQSAEGFRKYIFPLADALDAAIGASMGAVASGYAPYDWQVGQTGKIVAPKLYIAVGISGATEHLAGMKDSKVIVAINNDANAPIFEIADFGLVADIFEVLGPLTQAVKKSKQTNCRN